MKRAFKPLWFQLRMHVAERIISRVFWNLVAREDISENLLWAYNDFLRAMMSERENAEELERMEGLYAKQRGTSESTSPRMGAS